MGKGEHIGELEAMVLAAVVRLGDDAWGTSVYREIESTTGRDPTVPAIHVTLRRLEAKGLAVSQVGDPSPRGGRPRRYYRLTSEGTRALLDFREMWRALWTGLELPDPGSSS